MKNQFLLASLVMLALCSCKKNIDVAEQSKAEVVSQPNSMTEYMIKQGQQYCDKNMYQAINTSELKFVVQFDSSAIYQTINAANQGDINKLYGFSDNNAMHHHFSARFGWRWKNNQLQIFAYIYNNSVMSFQQIGIANIGEANTCSIKILGNAYMFMFNQTNINIPRASTTTKGIGYKLYPYFGGNEMAPHDIRIWIKEL